MEGRPSLGLARGGVLRIFRSSSHGHVDLIDVSDSADQADIGFHFFKSRARGRVNVTVARTIDHDVCENRLASRLALEYGAAHGSFGIHNGVDAPAIQVRGDSRIEDHVSQHVLEGFRVDRRVDGRFVPVDDSVLEDVQFLHQLFADAEDDLLFVSIVKRKYSQDEAAGCESSEIAVPLDQSDVHAQPLRAKRGRRARRTASDNQDAGLLQDRQFPARLHDLAVQRSSRELSAGCGVDCPAS